MNKTITLTAGQTGRVIVRFAYDPDLVVAIKSAVPAYARSWDPDGRRWLVEVTYVDDVTAEARHLGYRVDDRRTTSRERRRTTSPPTVGWADALFQAVGPDLAEPVFRALTRVLHPDLETGDTRLMQELNAGRPW